MKATVEAARITTPTDRQIRVERTFDAPRDQVWRAFTDPKLLAQWWGRGNRLAIERLELRQGGRWRFVEHGPDGDFGFEGEFREITPQERITQTFGWDGMKGHAAVDTATFESAGPDRTRVVSTTEFVSREERDGMLKMGMESGLNQSYAALDRVLASQR
jgi:uncharacterized protein YndB with AHSA1/START domain